MGTASTRIERHIQGGFQVDPKKSPQYFHSIENGEHCFYGGHSKTRIDSSLSVVKVCSKEANSLQETLQNEFFTRWDEKCNIKEYNGFHISKMDELLHKISDNFAINGMNLYNKLSCINFCKKVDIKIYEFTFGQELSSGLVNFGMVAISKENDVLDAISCLYTLNFQMARVLVTKKKKKRFAGINMGTSRRSWFEQKNLGFITQRAFINFCRYKALQEFNKRNLVTMINDVSSLTDV